MTSFSPGFRLNVADTSMYIQNVSSCIIRLFPYRSLVHNTPVLIVSFTYQSENVITNYSFSEANLTIAEVICLLAV